MDVIFARQPILNEKRELYGYELLYRRNVGDNTSGADGNAAFDNVKATAYILEVLSSISIREITGGVRAFVNFPYELLLQGYATLFPPEHLVIEILENTEPTQELIDVVCDLKSAGYLIALDDFLYDAKYKPLIELADIIKVEVDMKLESIENLFRVIYACEGKKIDILAEKVETQEVFDACLYAGCAYFQGYFFSKPVVLEKKMMTVNYANYVRLIAYVNSKDINFDEITQIVRQDVTLTYKLLTLVNSAFYSRGNSISDIGHAVVMLGEQEVRKWISFISLNSISNDKPTSLVKMSICRANFCASLAEFVGRGSDSEGYFLAGMFSLLDALLDTTMDNALATLNLSEEILAALKGEDNSIHDAIETIKALEVGDWQTIEQYMEKFGCKIDEVMQIYMDSLHYSDTLIV